MPLYKFLIRNKNNDPRNGGYMQGARALGFQHLQSLKVQDLYFIEGQLSQEELQQLALELLSDPVTQIASWMELPSALSKPEVDSVILEVALRPGVTDPLDIRDLRLRDVPKGRKITVVVQHHVELHRPFGPPKLRPVKQLHAQVNGRGVQAHQLILESKLPLPARSLKPATLPKIQEHQLVKLPRPVLIGVGQTGAVRSLDPQMRQVPLTTGQPPANLPQAVSSTQLANQHGNELTPARQAPSMPLGSSLSDRQLKLAPRKQLQQLAENATESIHGRASFGDLDFAKILIHHRGPTHTPQKPPWLRTLNLDKSAAIYDRLTTDDQEALSQALNSGRRMINAFADAVYPPGDSPGELSGESTKSVATKPLTG